MDWIRLLSERSSFNWSIVLLIDSVEKMTIVSPLLTWSPTSAMTESIVVSLARLVKVRTSLASSVPVVAMELTISLFSIVSVVSFICPSIACAAALAGLITRK